MYKPIQLAGLRIENQAVKSLLNYYTKICLEELGKTRECICQDI
jgi:hypothetical protein